MRLKSVSFGFLFMLLLMPVSLAAADSRLETLKMLYKRNEHALAWYRICVSNTELPTYDFMDNVDLISVELIQEIAKVRPEMTKTQIQDRLLQESERLQRFNERFSRQQGCDGVWAAEGEQHYDLIERLESSAILSFIESQGGQ